MTSSYYDKNLSVRTVTNPDNGWDQALGNSGYVNCRLCPRNCGIDRTAAQRGVCGMTDRIMAARAALHFWEEPCISGTSGSGAVFFSGCNLGCVFCQNKPIAGGEVGKEISVDRLAEIFLELQEQGANNINLVTAGHFLPTVIDALEKVKYRLDIPIVYNNGGYESVESIRALDGLVDIYLPDLKYVSSELSRKYSHAADYFEAASRAIEEMVRQTEEPLFYVKNAHKMQRTYGLWASEAYTNITAEEYNEICDSEEFFPEGDSSDAPELLMKRGTIVRHLLLPGCVEDSKAVVRYLYETFGDDIYLSIMNQFTPLTGLEKYPELNRKVTDAEYEEILDYAIDLGVNNAFFQEGDVAEESFIPAFDSEGI